MTAHTPPTPPAARERKLETVCLEASTISVFTSSAEGNEGVEEEDEEEDMAGGDLTAAVNRRKRWQR